MFSKKWIAAVAVCLFPMTVQADTYSTSNIESAVNSGYLSLFYTPVTAAADYSYSYGSGGSINFAHTSGANVSGNLENIGLQLNLADVGGPTSGDFSTSVTFSNYTYGGGLDQLELHTSYDNGDIFFDVLDNSSGLNAHVWNGAVNNPTPAENYGTFTITRSGSTVTGYYDGNAIFSQNETGTLDNLVFILQNNEGSPDNITGTFSSFSYSAADYSTATPLPKSAMAGVALLGLVSVGKWRSRRAVV